MMPVPKKKILSAVKISLGVIWWLFVSLLAIILINIFSAKMSGRVPSVFGYSVMNIVSGSMEDEIPKDSYILIKRIDPAEVKKDDIICFYSTDPVIYGLPNTHRVAEEPIFKDGSYYFVTRGDANSVDDKVLAEGDKLIGIYVKNLDGVTALSRALEGNTLIVIISVIMVLMTGMVVYTAVSSSRKKNTKK